MTFQHNSAQGRHGWLRLTPAYSVKVVEDILADVTRPLHVFDPFSGTGTTALCATTRGHRATVLDINPFLVWFGTAKAATYDARTLETAESAIHEIPQTLRGGVIRPVDPPPIFNIERWWDTARLAALCRLKAAIDRATPDGGPIRHLLLIAFCRTMIGLSNAAFNHQSMSFKTSHAQAAQRPLFAEDPEADCEVGFAKDAALVMAGAAENPSGQADCVLGDARSIDGAITDPVDLLITSPPYPNRMSYIRELRPYMYWLGYLREGREAGNLDWQAIGGTWGIATSRVAAWNKDADTYFPDFLPAILDGIRATDARSGAVLACYVGKYFEDIWRHLVTVRAVLRRGASAHYIVGNSKFYDVLVPVERIYADMLQQAGASAVRIVPLRKRNSKKELVEFDVVASF